MSSNSKTPQQSVFDIAPDRLNTNSYKWDSAEANDIIPMWVADMDFRTADAVIEALRQRVDHGVFGYTRVPDDYYRACSQWFGERHGLHFDASDVIYTSGVVPAISAIIKALTQPGDKVVVLTPVYNCFFSSIRNNGCEVSACELRIDTDGLYHIDFEALEKALADDRAKVMLICNPHNPGGRVWTRDELSRIARLCIDHGVTPVSDEIHCELVYKPNEYIPFGSLSNEVMEASVSCLSPSKAFNIAGLQIANIVCRNAERRARIDKAININEVCDVNPFGVIATIAAYEHGADWLNGLVSYLDENRRVVEAFFAEQLPDLPLMPLQSTYLAWLDCRSLQLSSEQIEHSLIENERVWINAGSMYGQAGEGFIRINFACPRERLLAGLHRIVRGLKRLGA